MNVQAGTIIRTLVLIAALVNQFLTAAGKNPLPWSEDELYQMITAIVTGIAAVIAWYKNNSYSTEAILADDYMHRLKEANKSE